MRVLVRSAQRAGPWMLGALLTSLPHQPRLRGRDRSKLTASVLPFAEPQVRWDALPCRWQERALGWGLEAHFCSRAGLGGAAGGGGGAGIP